MCMPKLVFMGPLLLRKPVTQPVNKILVALSLQPVAEYGLYIILCLSINFYWCWWMLRSSTRRVAAQLGNVEDRMHRGESSMEFQLVRQAPDLLNHLERASETLLQLARAG